MPFVKKTLAGIPLSQKLLVNFDFDNEALSIKTSEASLADGIRELIQNVIKAGTANTVTIVARKFDFGTCLDIADDGISISLEQVGSLFEKGHTNRKDGVGTGFGLWWIKTYMCKIGGELIYFERKPTGNIFRLLFPNFDISKAEK
jgi:signal transduction histidine kinase